MSEEDKVSSYLRYVPPWIIALTLLGLVFLAYLSFTAKVPFRVGKTYIGFESNQCPTNTCITRNGKCGKIKLRAWCTNPDTTPHNCGTEFLDAQPNQEYFTDPELVTADRGKRAGVEWVCIPSET